ncbi:MAG: 8-amino-7-oxononanoate synthase [Candidatus Omnitrophota bacterium]
MERRISAFLEKRKRDELLRHLEQVEFRGKGKVTIQGKEYIDFSSNDYLGLASNQDMIERIRSAVLDGTAVSASRLMTGGLSLHHRLEEKIARFKNKPAALIFNSGYQANIGIISALCEKEDCIFSDRLNHASIIDGIRLSGASFFRFRHNDTGHLKELLEKERAKFRNALIVTETLFSMDGDIAPLNEIVELKNKYGCKLMVDEAHATGVFGPEGRGLAEQKGVSQDIDIIMGTFSKALAGFGAYAAFDNLFKQYLVNTCRSFIYSTALPTFVIAGNIAALDIVSKEDKRREGLLFKACYLRKELLAKGFDVRGESQIIPVITGENRNALTLCAYLKDKGFWTLPVRTPTVPVNESRIRISLSYDHTREMIDNLLLYVNEWREDAL